MDDKKVSDYTALITSQHRQKQNYIAMIKAVSNPIVGCFNFLNNVNSFYDVDTAPDPYLQTLARWTGTPLVIPGASELEYFGFVDQEMALTFGETGDPSVGGYFRESGQSGTGGLTPTGDLLRQLIKAKILKNKSTGNINEAKEILVFVLSHDQFTVKDNLNMTVTFTCKTVFTKTHKILVQMFFPLPSGVQLIIAS